MLELNQKTLKVLTRVFWAALVVTSISWVGSITSSILEKRKMARTEESGTPIAVPAEH